MKIDYLTVFGSRLESIQLLFYPYQEVKIELQTLVRQFYYTLVESNEVWGLNLLDSCSSYGNKIKLNVSVTLRLRDKQYNSRLLFGMKSGTVQGGPRMKLSLLRS